MTLEQLLREFMRHGIAHEFRWVQEFACAQFDDSKSQMEVTAQVLERRKKGEPLAYIFRSWPFCGVNFEIGPGVLIPRPETEELAIELSEKIKKSSAFKNSQRISLVDFGSGSGCLGLGILSNLFEQGFENKIDVYLVEKSRDAHVFLEKNVELVRKHTDNFGQVTILKGDWNEIKLPEKIDIVVSNPPYIRENEFHDLDASVKKFEPKEALVPCNADSDGVSCYREIFGILSSNAISQKPKLMAFEFGFKQEQLLVDLFSNTYSNAMSYSLSIKQDMCGKERFLWAEMR